MKRTDFIAKHILALGELHKQAAVDAHTVVDDNGMDAVLAILTSMAAACAHTAITNLEAQGYTTVQAKLTFALNLSTCLKSIEEAVAASGMEPIAVPPGEVTPYGDLSAMPIHGRS